MSVQSTSTMFNYNKRETLINSTNLSSILKSTTNENGMSIMDSDRSSIDISLESFNILKVIGRGSFGKVYLV